MDGEPKGDFTVSDKEIKQTEHSTWQRVAPIIDNALHTLKDTSISQEDRAGSIVSILSNPAINEVLGDTGLELRFEDGWFGFHTPDMVIGRGNVEDSVALIEQVMFQMYPLLTEHISTIKERWPKLKPDAIMDIGMYLQAAGLTQEESSVVRSFEGQVIKLGQAEEYLQAFVGPEKPFSVLSLDGSSATVFVDEEDSTAYKVYDTNPAYPSMTVERNKAHAKKEIDVMDQLKESGLPPKVIASNIDDPDARTAIIAFEYIDFDTEIDQVDQSIREAQVAPITDVFWDAQLVPGDCEFVWDKRNQRVRVLDVHGIDPIRPPANMPTMQMDKEYVERSVRSQLELSAA